MKCFLVIGLVDQVLHVAADMLETGRAPETVAAGDMRLSRHPVGPTKERNSPSAMSRSALSRGIDDFPGDRCIGSAALDLGSASLPWSSSQVLRLPTHRSLAGYARHCVLSGFPIRRISRITADVSRSPSPAVMHCSRIFLCNRASGNSCPNRSAYSRMIRRSL